VSRLLKLIQSPFLTLLLTQIVKHKLKIFIRCTKQNFILSTVQLVIMYFYKLVIYKNKTIDDIEHTFKFCKLVLGVYKLYWIEMINTTIFLKYKTPFYKLANIFVQSWGFSDLFSKEIEQIWRLFSLSIFLCLSWSFRRWWLCCWEVIVILCFFMRTSCSKRNAVTIKQTDII